VDGTSSQRLDITLLLVARGIRGFGDGFAAIVLPAYLVAIGFGTVEIGIVAAASLFGSALLTLGVGVVAPRYELRHLLIAGAVLMAATGVMLNVEDLLLIVAVAFIGTVNPSAGDVGMLVPLEQTVLARDVTDRDRTRVFARYSLIGAMSSAAGALSAAVPDVLVDAGIGRVTAFKLMFCCYGVLGLLAAALYRRLRQSGAEQHHVSTPLGPSRGMVYSSRFCSVSMPSPAASSCNRCWRCGCSSASASRCRPPACSFSGLAC
jgi:MFS family permease